MKSTDRILVTATTTTTAAVVVVSFTLQWCAKAQLIARCGKSETTSD